MMIMSEMDSPKMTLSIEIVSSSLLQYKLLWLQGDHLGGYCDSPDERQWCWPGEADWRWTNFADGLNMVR